MSEQDSEPKTYRAHPLATQIAQYQPTQEFNLYAQGRAIQRGIPREQQQHQAHTRILGDLLGKVQGDRVSHPLF